MTTEALILTNVAENNSVKCGLLEGGIFYSLNKRDQLCTADDMKFVFDHYDHISEGKPMRILAEMAPFSTVDKSAREYLQKHQVEAICEAVIIYSLSQRLLMNFYHSFKSHSHPSKVFKNQENALKWVDSFK